MVCVSVRPRCAIMCNTSSTNSERTAVLRHWRLRFIATRHALSRTRSDGRVSRRDILHCRDRVAQNFCPRSLSDIDRSTAANDPRSSASFSAQKNPQRIPASTLPVFPGLRPRIWSCLLRLATKAMSDRLLIWTSLSSSSSCHCGRHGRTAHPWSARDLEARRTATVNQPDIRVLPAQRRTGTHDADSSGAASI